MAKTRVQLWEEKLEKLSNQRELNVNRYIIPIEMKIEQLRDKIRGAKK